MMRSKAPTLKNTPHLAFSTTMAAVFMRPKKMTKEPLWVDGKEEEREDVLGHVLMLMK